MPQCLQGCAKAPLREENLSSMGPNTEDKENECVIDRSRFDIAEVHYKIHFVQSASDIN